MKIKISPFLTVALLVSSLSSFAQDDETKGIRAGWQASNFYENSTSSSDLLNAFYVGYFHEVKIVPMIHFHSGLDYMQTGYNYKETMFGNTIDAKFTSHVLTVPLALKLKLGPVFALAGTGLNFNVWQRLKENDLNSSLPVDTKIKFFDMPATVGVGVKIAIITIEARYHWGLFDASESDLSSPKVQYFQIGAGISL